jgi:hypothetical protein
MLTRYMLLRTASKNPRTLKNLAREAMAASIYARMTLIKSWRTSGFVARLGE